MKKWILHYNVGLAGTDAGEIVEVPGYFSVSDVIRDFLLFKIASRIGNSKTNEKNEINCWAEEYKDES